MNSQFLFVNLFKLSSNLENKVSFEECSEPPLHPKILKVSYTEFFGVEMEEFQLKQIFYVLVDFNATEGWSGTLCKYMVT